MKSLILIASLLVPSAYAQACITQTEAKQKALTYLSNEGPKEFPYAFANKTADEKEQLVQTLANDILPLSSERDGEDGYAVLVYEEIQNEEKYQEFLMIKCDGTAYKDIERSQY